MARVKAPWSRGQEMARRSPAVIGSERMGSFPMNLGGTTECRASSYEDEALLCFPPGSRVRR